MLSAPALCTHAGKRALLRRRDTKTRLQNSLKKIYGCGSDFASFWPLQRQTSERTISAPTGLPLSRLLLMSISNITPVISSICSRECYFVSPCMKEMCFFLSLLPFQISQWAYFLFLCTFKFSLNRSGTKRQAALPCKLAAFGCVSFEHKKRDAVSSGSIHPACVCVRNVRRVWV